MAHFLCSSTDKGLETIDNEPVSCLRYSLPYYLVVKDAQAAQKIAEETMAAGKDTAEFENTVTWNSDPNLSDNTTVEAEFKPAQKSISYNDQRDLATYQLTLNPQGMKLNDGQMIRVEDAYENLAVDFSTIEIQTVPADRKSQINWAYHSNKGTFWIPDETVVIITYQAQPIGDAGKNVTIKNELTMLTWKETVEKTVTLNSESEGSAGDYNIRLFKYKDDFMNQPLSGAIFQLFEAGTGVDDDVQKNGKWYRPVKYQTKADVNTGSDEYTHTPADVIADDVFLKGKDYPSRLHHKKGDEIYFSTGANGYSDIHLSQSRDGVALERGKQYYLYEVVTPDGYDKEDIYWSFIIDDMDFFDSAHGIYQYRDGGVLTVSNESSQDKGIVISKSFTGDARDALDWNKVEFEIVGVDKEKKEVFRREVSFEDFVKYKLKLPTLPNNENGPYTYTITEKNADVATADRTTTVTLTKTTAGDIDDNEKLIETIVEPTSERTTDGFKVSFTVEEGDLKATSETAFKVTFENNYVEKPVELTLNKTWGENAEKLTDKKLTLALYKDGEEYPLYKDGDAYRPVSAASEYSTDAVRIILSDQPEAVWTAKVADLPRYENGKPIEWTVKEVGASFTQDGHAITVSEEDMDMQFNITASMQTGVDENGELITESVKVEHAEACIDTTSTEKANLTLHNELATLATVKVEKKWYDEDGHDVTDSKLVDDAITYDLYRTTDELPKGGQTRDIVKIERHYDSQAERYSPITNWTKEIEIKEGDVLEITYFSEKNQREGGYDYSFYGLYTKNGPYYQNDKGNWVSPLGQGNWAYTFPFNSFKGVDENGNEIQFVTSVSDKSTTSTQLLYSTDAPKTNMRGISGYYYPSFSAVTFTIKIDRWDPVFLDTSTLYLRCGEQASFFVRNITQGSENLTHDKLEKFVEEHSQTTELFRENLTLGELEEELTRWSSVNNYPDGYTYFAIEHTPAGYEDTYSIVDDEDGNEVITIENRPVKIEQGHELGKLTVQKTVTGLPDSEEYQKKEYHFRIKNGSKYLVKTNENTYTLMSLAQLTNAQKTLDADATYTIQSGESGKLTFSGLYPAIYTIEEVGNPQVDGYTLETTYSGNGRIGVNLGQTSSATITNAYTPEDTQVIFGKLWADGDNKPVAWPEGQNIEVVVHRHVKDMENSEDSNFNLTYTIDTEGATLKSSNIPLPENMESLKVEALTENAVTPYYAYRYQISGLSKKVLTGASAGKEWIYYVTENVPTGATYECKYGALNGTVASASADMNHAEAKVSPDLTETDYIINQFSQKEISFTKTWYDGVNDSAIASWPQREKVEYDDEGNIVTRYDDEGHVITEQEYIPISVTVKRKLAYDEGLSTDYDPLFEVSFSNLTPEVSARETNSAEGKLTLKMVQSGSSFKYTFSGLKEKGDMDEHSGEWKYFIIESAVDGYGTSYVLSSSAVSEGMYTDEGGQIHNTRKLGTIVIEKKTEGLPESEKDRQFSFTVKNAESKYLTLAGELVEAADDGTVKIKSGEKAVFKNVPAGDYTVQELGTEENGSAQIYGYSLQFAYDKSQEISIADDDVKTVTVTNTYTPETIDFSFTKVWYGADGNTPTDWITESINVTLDRSFKPNNGEEIKGEPITMAIYSQDGNSGYDYTVEKKTDPTTTYVIQIKGLEKWVPRDKLPADVESGKWVYTLTEAVPTGYYAHYFKKDSDAYQNAQFIDDGGKVENHLSSYELPSTGGPGNRANYLLGSMLVCLAGAIIAMRKKQRAV